MDDIEKAYLAGIVDGEGAVTLMRHHANETATPYVSVSNNSLELLEWIKLLVGGLIIRKKKKLPHHKNSYTWSVRQNRAIRLLNEIKQYLIIKRKQAELITSTYKLVTHRSGKYTPEMLTKKNELVRQIRLLNQR